MNAILQFPTLPPTLHRREAWASLAMLAVLVLNTLLAALPTTIVLPAPAAAGDATMPGEGAAIDALPPVAAAWLPAEVQGKPELAGLRSAHTAAYDMGDGSFARILSQTPLHYQDADGAWQPVNPFFRKQGGDWLDSSNSVRVAVDDTFSTARIGIDGAAVAWHPQALELVSGDGDSRTLAAPRRPGE